MKRNLYLAAFASLALFFTSCEKDDSTTSVSGTYAKGVLVVNEGNSSTGSSISFLNLDSSKVTNNLFSTVNASKPLGIFAQSITCIDGKYFIAVTNSNKIEVVNQSDFKIIKTIEGLRKPRYIEKISSTKAYVSEWGTDYNGDSIAVLNLSTLEVTKRIKVGLCPDKMLINNNIAYIANKGYIKVDSTISVVNTLTDNIIATINVGAAPEGFALDKNNRLWVLCSGGEWQDDYSMKYNGSLCRINISSNTVENEIPFASKYSQPASLVTNLAKDNLLFTYNGLVYQMSCTDTEIPVYGKIFKYFNHINVDPKTGNLYATDPSYYKSEGYLFRYKATTFEKIDSFKVGIGCGEIYFNN